jgi:hypothetical protein
MLYDISPAITVNVGHNNIGFYPEREEPKIVTSSTTGFTGFLHVVSEHKLKRMGGQIDLTAEILFIVFSHIVLSRVTGTMSGTSPS